MTCPCSSRAICFFVTRSSARMAVIAIAGCALRLSRFRFIFRIGQRASRQRGYTICITSRPSMKQIGQGKRKSPRGKLRVAARVTMRRGFLTLAHSALGWLLHRGDFSLVHPLGACIAAASVSCCRPVLADQAREILNYVNSRRARENGRKVTGRTGEDKQMPNEMTVA